MRLRTICCRLALLVLVSGMLLQASMTASRHQAYAQSPGSLPLVQLSNLVHQGAFRVPQGSTDQTSFSYGGTALAYNAASNSLFMVGHSWYQRTAEINIPNVVNSTTLNSLNTATLRQPFADATDGKVNQVNPSDPNSKGVGGHMVYGGKLYVSAGSYYDAAGTQSSSHFARPINLSTTGQVIGPVRVGNQYPGFVSGYMTQIPSEWQSLFGGPALTGNCCLPIVSVQSNGPAASVFNPNSVGVLNPVPATPVVGYPHSNPLADWDTTNLYFNGTTQVTGIVFPSGTRSVLFFGRHGVGTFCYGTGAECNDPADGSKGTHAYPYKYQIWAYDANDLLAVKNGTKQQWEPRPYAVWNFNLPFENTNDDHRFGGAAYDPATGRIYVAQGCADADCRPIIHVFKVNVNTPPPDTTPPSSPTALIVQ